MGVQKNIKDEDEMWDHFTKYRTETKANPFLLHDFVGKDGHPVYRRKERCLTLDGFYNWLEDNKIIVNADHYFSNRDKAYESFVAVCARIRRVIRQDQIEGGMAGAYNTSITQRLNGLVEKSEVVQVKEQPLFDLNGDEKKDE